MADEKMRGSYFDGVCWHTVFLAKPKKDTLSAEWMEVLLNGGKGRDYPLPDGAAEGSAAMYAACGRIGWSPPDDCPTPVIVEARE